MDLGRLEALGLIEKAEFSAGQVESNLSRARRDLATAKVNLKIDEEWAYAIAYHAMLRAGRAFMFASGYRPRGGKGRTGTVVGCYLVRHGLSGQEALEKIRDLRRLEPTGHQPSPESTKQRDLVVSWAN